MSYFEVVNEDEREMETGVLTLLLCGICALLVKPVLSYSHGDMQRLMSDLFNESGYSKIIRPLSNQSEAIQVTTTIVRTR